LLKDLQDIVHELKLTGIAICTSLLMRRRTATSEDSFEVVIL